MKALELLKYLSEQNILVSEDNGELDIEAPKGTLTSDIIGLIKTHKLELVEFLFNQKQLHGYQEARPPLVVMERSSDSSIPLSFAQQRMWLIDQMNDGSSEYNLPKAIRVAGNFEVSVAERAIASIIKRHESLRSVFKSENGEPVQVVQQEFCFSIEKIDLTQSDKQARELARIVAEKAREPFALDSDLMVKVVYILLDENEQRESVLLFNVHHIASDGWSTGLLIREFMAEYQSILENKPTTLSPLTIQYADFANWQRSWLHGSLLDNQLAYWQQQLKDIPAVHSIPLDFNRPQTKCYHGDIVTSEISAEVAQQLKELALANGTTLFVLLHAALSLVLSKHSHSNDIVIGSPVANRMHSELESLIGFFVNTLVLRVDTGHNHFSELLAHVKKVNIDAQVNQDIPFEQLVDLCNVPRNVQYTPLTQVMLSVNTNEVVELEMPGLKFSPFEESDTIAKFDLELSAASGENGIYLHWTFDTSIFSKQHISQLNKHLTSLLQQVAENPDLSINELCLLSNQEKQFLLTESNPEIHFTPQQSLIHQRFEQIAALYPDNQAVFEESESISYRELNQQANQLANHLIKQGVGSESLVGICFDRSIEMMISMLAILKSGGAYVPFDPQWPTARKDYLISDTKLSYLLVQENYQQSFVETSYVLLEVIKRESFNRLYSNYSTENVLPNSQQHKNQLAYIIYTSGSTGNPKGVMVEHENVLQLVIDEPCVEITPEDCMVYCANPAFDASTWEIWGALLNGAKLQLISHQCLMDVEQFSQQLGSGGATILQLTAGLFSQYCQHLKGPFSKLKYLLWGGDKVDSASVRYVIKNCPPKHLIHTYGPTETVAFTITSEVNSVPEGSSIPIGKHTLHSSTYLLDENQQLVPSGAIGELYIGGPGVARGYLNQDKMTHEKFICNPYSSKSNERLYRTGDLARYLSNGELEFIGRTDDQVKIRGFRIELGEIEQHLSAIDSVTSNLVTVREDRPGQKQLVAYLVKADDAKTDLNLFVDEIKQRLLQSLPEYMLPSAFIVLDEFPLTANGKIDRRALPAVDSAHLQTQYLAPSTKIEQQLVEVWAELLKLDANEISVNANFFELGGYSLLIARLNHQVTELFDVKFEYQAFFEAPTIKALANVVRKLRFDQLDVDQIEKLLSDSDIELKEERKILLTMNLPYTRCHGGANKSNRILVERLVELGYQVNVVTPALAVPSDITIEQLIEQLKQQNIDVINNDSYLEFSINGVNIIAVIEANDLRNKLQSEISYFEPDWVFISAEDSSQLLLRAAIEVSPDNIVYFAHTPQMLPFGPESFYPGESRKLLIEKVHTIITISHYVADYLKTHMEHPSIFVNHPPHFGDDHQALGDFSNQYVLAVNPCEVKGISILLELAKNNPEIKFAVVPGWGTTPENIAEMKSLSNIEFFENQSDLNQLFKDVKVLLMPSIWGEGFGMICIDAMLRGVPVLASKTGGITEAKLGTDYLIPVNTISSYKDELDQNYIPKANVGLQDLTPWQNALTELFSDKQKYQEESLNSRNAALEFVDTLSVDPLHEHLIELEKTDHRFEKTRKRRLITAWDSASFSSEKLIKIEESVSELLLAKKQNSSTGIVPLKKQALYDVSFSQRQLLLLDELNDGYYGFILSGDYPLQQSTNIEQLIESVDLLIQRHEAFRTQFVKFESGYKQRVFDNANFTVEVTDLPEDEDKIKSINQHLSEVFYTPFDLYNDCLVRMRILRSSDGSLRLLVAMHHIISDGSSMEILIRELHQIYNALSLKQPVDLPPLAFSYKDFAAWQLNSVERLEKEHHYWSAKLTGKLTPIELPLDYARPVQKSYRGATCFSTMDIDLSKQLKGYVNKQNASLLMGLIAIVKTLLSKYGNHENIAVGIPSSGRYHPDLQDQIGFFVNMLVINDEINLTDNFSSVFNQVRQTALEAYDHEAYPFSRLIEQVPCYYDPARSPFFDVMVSLDYLDDANQSSEQSHDADIEQLERQVGSSHDLAFLFVEQGDNISLQLTYNSDLFKQSTIDRMFKHFSNVTGQVLNNPAIQLSEIALIGKQEEQWLTELNLSEQTAFLDNVCLHQKFEEVVNLYPEKNAIDCVDSKRSITYRELNQHANQMAHLIISKGIKQGDVIPIIADNSLEAVIYILAVLKAGCCYLPLNPEYPLERICYLLEECSAKIILTDNRRSKLSVQLTDRELITLNDVEVQQQSKQNPTCHTSAQELAYILYTSGTTAEPKGVMVDHSNVMRLFFNDDNLFEFSDKDVWTLFHSICFDFSVWEIFGALLFGGNLIIVSKESKKDSLALSNIIREYSISVLNQVPNVFYNLLNVTDFVQENKTSLRYVIFGGDLLEPAKLGAFHKGHSKVKLINMYGITETAIHTTFKSITQKDIDTHISNIGKPLPTVSLHLLDQGGQYVPVNTVGELFVGGYGLTHGYLNAPALTDEKFVINPQNSKQKLYRTGDLAKLLDNGEFEYLGRIDNQVNIRGFRIGLGEVEFQFAKLALVEQVVVVVKKDAFGDSYLAAFIISNDLNTARDKQLNKIRKEIAEALPAYMTPSAIVILDEMPLTNNGKIDKKALVQLSVSSTDNEYIAPESEIEIELARIWGKLLKVSGEQISASANFFELGGHSLLLVRMSTEIRECFQLEIPIKEIMENPCLNELNELISKRLLTKQVSADSSTELLEEEVEITI